MVWDMPLVTALRRQRNADLCEFEVSLVYIVSSKMARKQQNKMRQVLETLVSMPSVRGGREKGKGNRLDNLPGVNFKFLSRKLNMIIVTRNVLSRLNLFFYPSVPSNQESSF